MCSKPYNGETLSWVRWNEAVGRPRRGFPRNQWRNVAAKHKLKKFLFFFRYLNEKKYIDRYI